MKRKDFLLKSALSLFGIGIGSKAAGRQTDSKINIKNQVGFNHIRTMETKTATTVLHKADSRGKANHGWLNSYHTFSFANYYNPDRVNFGMLRVLNDDKVAPAREFNKHPLDNSGDQRRRNPGNECRYRCLSQRIQSQ